MNSLQTPVILQKTSNCQILQQYSLKSNKRKDYVPKRSRFIDVIANHKSK